MDGKIIGFIIWSALGLLFIILAVYSLFTKKPMRFWANADVFEVTDIKAYNRAISKLFSLYGVVIIILGLPLLSGQNSAWILLSIVGLMIASILLMIIYTNRIEKKYRKR
ncbi:hypothetical protein [Diplocloster agilis]|uniref:DUF3784 domain-containing protein n=1 Tax=Diplocloster agilis TaxID=2850323 RepID=A0A949NG48_9FIRM|nr:MULTISPECIES: hypothetical protein [Lachnospiraceae]MBU9735993.1 hypothetical protein [Diplocloster agilis]MBU9747170.1 hypothetical protein [Diplocloster agilis]MCU6732905.1 hypothetical protein [Suonthocola fibrivorans]SCI66503.1 Uncharacterised protein [uncultured Clostridium sp.]